MDRNSTVSDLTEYTTAKVEMHKREQLGSNNVQFIQSSISFLEQLNFFEKKKKSNPWTQFSHSTSLYNNAEN